MFLNNRVENALFGLQKQVGTRRRRVPDGIFVGRIVEVFSQSDVRSLCPKETKIKKTAKNESKSFPNYSSNSFAEII